jgi:DNA-binding MarR family transcriptional regulator
VGDESFRVVEAHLAQHQITHGGFSVLMALWGCSRREGPEVKLCPAALAECTGVTRATMTGLVDTLERDGLVRREPDPNDRRMMIVDLTARGEARLLEILPNHFRRMAWLLAPLSENERKSLVGLLMKVLKRAAEPVEVGPAERPALAVG